MRPDNAKKFISVIQELVDNSFARRDVTRVARVQFVDPVTGDVSISFLPNLDTQIGNIPNKSGETLTKGDTVLVFCIGGSPSNAFIMTKYQN